MTLHVGEIGGTSKCDPVLVKVLTGHPNTGPTATKAHSNKGTAAVVCFS
jgi:hypothetical protein